IRVLGEGVQMRPEFIQRELSLNRLAIAHHVEVRDAKVDDTPPFGPGDVRVADVPLVGDCPVEHLRPARHLVDLKWNPRPDRTQGLSHSLAGDAAADREELPHQLRHPLAAVGAHSPASKSGYVRSRSLMISTSPGQSISNAGSSQRTPRAASDAQN